MYLIYLKFRSKDGYQTSRKKGAWIFLPTTSSSHFEEEERSVTFRCATFESRMRGVFTEGHVEASPQTLGGGGGISQPPPSCFFSSRDTSRGFPFAVPPPFTQGWIRFRRMKSPGGLDSATHRSSLHIYIYIYVVHSRIPLSPQ